MQTAESCPSNLSVYCGDLNANVARVYVQAPRPSEPGEWSLRGKARGPFSRFGHTLPMNYPLTDLGHGESLLGRIVIPEPSPWTRELASLYEISVSLVRSGVAQAETKISFGLRNFGAKDNRFVLNGKNWVIRGTRVESHDDSILEELREHFAAAYVRNPSEDWLEKASRAGVFVVAEIGNPCVYANEILRMARFAAVGVVVADKMTSFSNDEIRSIPSNLVLACKWSSDDETIPIWAGAVVVDDLAPKQAQMRMKDLSIPKLVIAKHKPTSDVGISELRARCDQLQAELAPMGQFAGYLVDRDLTQ